jgi:hypothetical protein
MTGYNTVRKELFVSKTEILSTVRDKHVILLKAAFIEQQRNALPGRQLSLLMLILNSLVSPSQACLLPEIKELLYSFLAVHFIVYVISL